MASEAVQNPPVPAEGVSQTQAASKEDVLDDGTRVIQTTYVETFPDGSQCKRTVTKRIKTPVVRERNVGHATISHVGLRTICDLCCCGKKVGKGNKNDDDDEEEEVVEEETKEQEQALEEKKKPGKVNTHGFK